MTDPKHEFMKHATKRDRLAELMADPVMVEALEAVKYPMDAIPGTLTEQNPVVAAARYQQLAGINFVIRELRSMTAEPTPERKPPQVKRLPTELPKTDQ